MQKLPLANGKQIAHDHITNITGLVWGSLAKEKLARLNKHNALIEVLKTENRLACCDLLQVKGREAQSWLIVITKAVSFLLVISGLCALHNYSLETKKPPCGGFSKQC